MKFLLINPPVYDFACYDLWMKPLGLLRLATLLEKMGDVFYLDCMDRGEEGVSEREDEFGCGKFYKEEVEKPECLKGISRPYFRYGLKKERVIEILDTIPTPDFVFITTGMTYWYPGVEEMVQMLRRRYPGVPIYAGGIYATLLPEHAKQRGLNGVFVGEDYQRLVEFLKEITGKETGITKIPLPRLEFLKRRDSFVLETSQGCPFRCAYCASFLLHPTFSTRSVEEVMEELDYFQDMGVKHIALYDDAFLFRSEIHALPILREIEKRNYNFTFHTPNGLHARFLNEEIAYLLKKTGFITVRLSLETSRKDLQEKTGGKVKNEELERAVKNLQKAGYLPSQIDVYLMLGLPGSEKEDLRESILYVNSLGCRVILANFSPIPGTPIWRELEEEGIVKEKMDPLWHNNTIFPLRLGWSLQEIREWRLWVKELNGKV